MRGRDFRPGKIAVFFVWLAVGVLSGAMPHAAVFYVDPVHGNMANDGSHDAPWSTLADVFAHSLIESRCWAGHPWTPDMAMVPKNPGAPVRAGDTLLLRDGYHGTLLAIEYYNAAPIIIAAQAGHTPALGAVEFRSSARWILRGLHISPELAPVYVVQDLVRFVNHGWTGPAWECVLEDCTLYSVEDAAAWSAADWDSLACNGIYLSGDDMVVRGNHLRNVNFGISVTGDDARVEANVIENFCGDGIRGLGDYGEYLYNTVKNCYDVNGNHDDGFQSWSVGDDGQVGHGVVNGLVLQGNTIINYEDPAQPLRGTLQGIGCFDGMFAGWRIENNVIRTDHWHGITLLGAVDCTVINNTVLDMNDTTPGPPWIRVAAHKDGTPSSGCVVRNNLTTSLNNDSIGVVADHNILITDPDDHFVAVAAGDLHLLSGSTAVDSGSALLAPTMDRDGYGRPYGVGWDIGAYESIPVGSGDLNGDTLVNEADGRLLADYLAGNAQELTFGEAPGDMDGDGVLTACDLAGLIVNGSRSGRR
ncbi:MAG: hypothetical protein JXQ27_02180 [Acidobacteria bacterium]|nr:hypothetical protein [Acidobacteriota bacterium]